MKQEITIVDPSTKQAKTVVVSDRPLDPVDVLTIAAKGYIASLNTANNGEYPSIPILDRDNAMMLSSVRIPFKSTTLVSVSESVTSSYSDNGSTPSSSTPSTPTQTSGGY